MKVPVIGVMSEADGDYDLYAQSVIENGGEPHRISSSEDLRQDTVGAIVGGKSRFTSYEAERYKEVITLGAERGIPLLGIGYGMQLINLAYGGISLSPSEDPVARKVLFLSPGGKVSHIIGGSGWVAVPLLGCNISIRDLSSELFGSCYSEERLLYAIESPGRNWVVGVSWPAEKASLLPKGFDNFIPSMIERASMRIR